MYSKEAAIQLKNDFWEAFASYTKFYAIKFGEPIEWKLYKTGIKGIELKFEIENKTIAVILEVNSKNTERRFDLFVELDKYKKILELGFNDGLIWVEDYVVQSGKTVSRIFVDKQGLNYYKTESWPEIFKFMAENMLKLQNNFMELQPILDENFGNGI